MTKPIGKRDESRGDGPEASPVSARGKKREKGGTMRKQEKEYFRKRVPKILEALKKKGYDPYFFESTDEATSFILERIDSSETVAIGGSLTIREDLSPTTLFSPTKEVHVRAYVDVTRLPCGFCFESR
jgi:hypothetical protein